MKPPTSYFGGKTRMSAWLAGVLPPHQVYIEPFFGSGALFFAKARVRHEIVNDRNGHVANFYRVLRDQLHDLELALRLTPYARDEFESADPAAPGLDPVERARRWWVQINYSFNSVGARSGFSISTNQNTSASRAALHRLDRFAPCHARLQGVTIENRDALELITARDCPSALHYIDPPYLDVTRTSWNDADGYARRPGGDYEVEFAAEDDHRRLASTVATCRGLVVVSGYSSPLYDELFDGWERCERPVMRYASNGRSTGPVPVTEVIWSNRPLATTPPLFVGAGT